MALLRNREVNIIGVSDGETPSQTFIVQDQNGEREYAKLSELTLTEKEHEDFKKAHGDVLSGRTKKINDKDYQTIKDDQDVKKIKDKQKKQPTSDQPVKVATYVKPSEVQSVTPTVTPVKK